MLNNEVERYGLSLVNHFLFLIPPLAWNVLFTRRLPMDHFSGEAPKLLLVAENIFRGAAMIYPIMFPIDTSNRLFVPGAIVYGAGMALYFGSWTFLMERPDHPLSQTSFLRFAPAFTPIIWLTGISLMMESPLEAVAAAVFIGFHVAEYIFRYPKT